MQTFSHFTYSYSNGMVMVTDVQVEHEGNYKLTDPAIHTAESSACLKDPTDLGRDGMVAFFSTHICNNFCGALSLKLPGDLDARAPNEHEASVYHDLSFEADREEIFETFD